QTDLALTKTDGKTSYVPGAPNSYTIVVTNAGPSDATGVSVADVVPAAMSGVTVTCTAAGTATCGTNASAGNTVSFTGIGIPVGTGNSLTITVSGVVSAATTGPLVNTATVTAGTGQTDPTASNNTATDTDTQGAGVADLAITKSDGQAGYIAGT